MRKNLFAVVLLVIVPISLFGSGCLSINKPEPEWSRINDGLPAYGICTAIAFDPFDSNLVYASVYYKRSIYRSDDGGRNWLISDNGLQGTPVFALAASPTRPSTIYAGAADGLYISSDSAHSWQRISAIPEKQIFSIFILPGTPDRIVAGSYSQIFVSENAGASWTDFSQGLQGVSLLSFVSVDQNPKTIIAGTNGGGVLRTNDGGATWNQVFATNTVVSSIAFAPTGGAIFARAENHLLRSAQRGTKWEDIGSLPGGVRPLNVTTSVRTLLAGTDGDGIYISVDEGNTWQQLGNGLARTRVTAIAVDPHNSMRIAAGTTHGIFLSYDTGQNWERGSPIGRPIVRSLISIPGEERFLAGTTDGVYERTTGTWQPLRELPKVIQVLSLAVTPGTPLNVYAGTWGASIQKSSAGGEGWQISAGKQFSETIIPAIIIDPNEPDRIYARVEYDRIIMSTDGGQSWQPADEGLMDVTVSALTAVPSHRGLLYAGTDKGIYRSLDGGGNWSSTGMAPWSGTIFAIHVDDANPERLLAGTTEGISFSSDGGKTWRPVKGCEDVSVSALTFLSANPKRGFAGTRFHGAYETDDGGMTWQPFGKGLADSTVNAFALDEKAGILYAGTEEGVFSVRLN